MSALKTYIVEDSAVIRENLVATLEELTPLRVVGTAADEASAARWLADPSNGCELAIIDIALRQGSGIGVLKVLRDTQRHCKRIVLSNYATPAMRLHCLAFGADAVFDKSSEIDALIGWCQRLADDTPAPPEPQVHQ